jgi:hypothetical protein
LKKLHWSSPELDGTVGNCISRRFLLSYLQQNRTVIETPLQKKIKKVGLIALSVLAGIVIVLYTHIFTDFYSKETGRIMGIKDYAYSRNGLKIDKTITIKEAE